MTERIPTGEYLEHETTPGERWDQVAARYYNDAHATSLIIRANAAQFLEKLEPLPVRFERRLILRIPVVQEIQDTSDLPFWKRP